MSPPVIFLDVDGVLNHRGVFVPGNPDPICPDAAARLLKLAGSIRGTAIVMSSTWRLGGLDSRHMRKVCAAGILTYLHDDWRTTSLPYRLLGLKMLDEPRRGREIAEWLSRHPEVANYVILDDDSDMLPEQTDRFVQTSFDTGLLDEHCARARAILEATPDMMHRAEAAGIRVVQINQAAGETE